MTFADVLNRYLNKYSLTVSSLSDASGVSKATLSRFKNGKREPSADSEAVVEIARAITELAHERGDETITAEAILQEFTETLGVSSADFERIVSNLNSLIDALNINVNDLSRYLKFDPSYLSRIRSGQRRPANVAEFCLRVAGFVCSHMTEQHGITLAHLIGCTEEEALDQPSCRNEVLKWLSAGAQQQDNAVQSFLEKLDSFDLNEYIRSIHFDTLKVPTSPFQLPTSKNYYKLSGFMEAELNWLKATALSRSTESVIMYSDMPIKEMSKDPEFPRKWMYGLALLLKKGLHLNIIHDVDRSLYEMMLGLEGWIPMYMTGQVSPYYFKGYNDNIFGHFLRVSGAAVISGESVVGFHEDGQYRLSKAKDEIAYMRTRGEELLAKARPLMEIYTEANAIAFSTFLQTSFSKDGRTNRNIRSAPPLATMPKELLNAMLDRNGISDEDRRKLHTCHENTCNIVESRLEDGQIFDEIPLITQEEFEAYPPILPLADIFYEGEIAYTYQEYQEHLEATRLYAETHPNYEFILTEGQLFRNIQIRIVEDEFVIISKNKVPAIHFVIRHPKLRQALENLAIPIVE